MTFDYRKFYDLEKYLLAEVGPRFRETRVICPIDFYLIIIWKANRAKTRLRDRLNKQPGGFAEAVEGIAASLHTSACPMGRLEVLMKKWGFRLPMASAILTVFYPDDFGVYDVRVCEQLGAFKELAGRQFSDGLWKDYQRFLNTVKATAPEGFSLRDKDRYLWGRSFYEATMRDLGG